MNLGFEIIRPIESHAKIVMDWRNDPQTVKMSFHRVPNQLEPFFKEFAQKYFDLPDLPPLFILDNGERVGLLRFDPALHPKDPQKRCCEISILVSPDHRGKNIASQAIQEIREWVHQQGYDAILALIKVENVPSVKSFESAGFSRLDTVSKKTDTVPQGIEIHRYIYEWPSKNNHKPVFVIAEAGSNWRMGTPARDLKMAKSLIDVAKESGADAVKFQIFKADTVYVKNAGTSDYLSEGGIKEDIHEIFEDLTMPPEMIPKLSEYCKSINIELMASFFSIKDFESINPYVKRHKIASYEISHIRLIQKAAQSGKPVIMSTGAANVDDISWAVQQFKENGGKDLTLLQCTAKYPAPLSSMNLQVIPWLQKRFGCLAGLSDHSTHPIYAPVAAVALGASVVEKHFTLDKRLPGPDHAFAVNPKELKEMIQGIRAAEQLKGSGVKTVLPDEEELFWYARRGVQAVQNINKGDLLKEGITVDILRPGKQKRGIHPKYLSELEGKKASRSISYGEGITYGDWLHE